MLELSLAEPLDVDETADAEGVEANIASLCPDNTYQQLTSCLNSSLH